MIFHRGSRIKLLLLMGAALIPLVLLGVAIGSTKMSFSEVVNYLFFETSHINHRILLLHRLPRVILAGLVGSSLALSGCLLQGVMGNPLASPNILGVSSGAGLSGVIVLILLPHYYYLVTPVAFAGALLTTLLIYGISWKGGSSPLRLILSGVAVSSFLSAGISTLMTLFPDRIDRVIGFMVGNISAVTWKEVNSLWPYTLGGLCLSLLLSNQLNILQLGDERAISLGLKVEKIKIIFIAAASLLAASAVSIVGLLGFVGLIVPHLTRLIVGNNARYTLPGSALLGAILVITCDLVGRVVIRPLELPVGVIMSLLGAPFFLFLLRKGGIRRG